MKRVDVSVSKYEKSASKNSNLIHSKNDKFVHHSKYDRSFSKPSNLQEEET